MKVEIEFRSFASRRELRQLLQIAIESTGRLSHRMDAPDLDRIETAARTLAGLAAAERRRRASPTIEARAVEIREIGAMQ